MNHESFQRKNGFEDDLSCENESCVQSLYEYLLFKDGYIQVNFPFTSENSNLCRKLIEHGIEFLLQIREHLTRSRVEFRTAHILVDLFELNPAISA